MTAEVNTTASQPSRDASSPNLSRGATYIIAGIVVAHDEALGALISQSAKLGADAWVDHEANLAKIENINCQISRTIAQRENTLNTANRRTQNTQTQHNVHMRISKQQNNENQALTVHTECLVDATHELTNRSRAIEAWQHAKLEANAEHERGDWLAEGSQHAVSMRATQIIERARQARVLVKLQHSLRVVCGEHCHALLAFKVHKSASTANAVVVTQLKIVRVREQLRDEGHKRRLLHKLELDSFRAETRRLLGDRESKIERSYLLLAVASVRLECDYVPSCVTVIKVNFKVNS